MQQGSGEPRFLVDNDLSPHIAEALSTFFNINHVKTVFPDPNNEGVGDEVIIPWCARTNTIWITHDKKSRRRIGLETDLKAMKITVLWISGANEFSNWQQFKVVVRVIDEVVRRVRASRGAIHFRAGIRGTPSPEILWAEYPQDMPRRDSPRRRQ